MNDKTNTVIVAGAGPTITGPFGSEEEARDSTPTWSVIRVWQDDEGRWWVKNFGPTTTSLPPLEG